MVIEKIDIKSFGFITDMTLEFSDSVNVIEGQNEAGKSTIAAFIKYMLFGFDTNEGNKGLSERKKRINWTTGVAEGSMIVRVKDKRYLISRSTVLVEVPGGRDTYKEESSILNMQTGINEFGKQPAGEVFFGVSRDLFENTAFIGQLGDSSYDETSVQQSIENIIFSGSEKINIQRAENRIADKMDNLYHNVGQGGIISDLEQKRDALEEQMERFNADNKEILAKNTELYKIRKERAESEENLNKLHELDSCYNDVMRIQTFERLNVLEKESEEKTEAYNKFIDENKHAGYVPNEEYLESIKRARQNVNETYQNLNDCEEAYAKEKSSIGITREIEGSIEDSDSLGGEEKVLSDAKTLRNGCFKNIGLSVVTLLLTIAAAVCEIVAKGGLASLASRVVIGILGMAAFAGLIYFTTESIRRNKKLKNLEGIFQVEGYSNLKGKIAVIAAARAKRDSLINSTETARVNFENAKESYSEAKKELTRIILKWGGEPPTSELNDYLDTLESKVTTFLEKLALLREDKTLAECTVIEVRRSLSGVNEMDVRSRVSPLKRKALSGINHDGIITGIASLKAKIHDLDKATFALESELVELRSRAGDPAESYMKMAALDDRIEELREKHKAYYVAARAIESASQNLRADISPRLGEYATELMNIMTNSKYKNFTVNDGLRVTYETENGEEKSVDFLSGGTRDLTYIAVRMALIDMLYPDKPPVVFDESFAHQDNNRSRSMMKALSHLAEKENQQSFIFTCRAREASLAEELVKDSVVFKLSLREDA